MVTTSRRVQIEDVTAVVLSGGRSTRFGSDKARFVVDGKPMIEHVVAAVRPFTREVVVAAGTSKQGQADTMPPGADATVYDVFADAGPLAGIHAGMQRARSPWVLVVSCDLLRITPPLIAALLERADDTVDAVVPEAAGKPPQYLCSLFRSSLLPIVEEQLRGKTYAVRDFIARIPRLHRLAWNGREIASVNTPGDLDVPTDESG